MINLSKEIFYKYISYKREDNGWDYKVDIDISSKKGFYELIRDILALSNYGGGYLLLGISNQLLDLVGVQNIIDVANLGDKIQKILGYSIDIKIFYFDHITGDKIVKLGILYVPPSVDIYVCPKTLNDSSNKTVIREGEILFRRNTRSVWADKDDIKDIIKRIGKKYENTEYLYEKPPINLIFKNSRDNRKINDTLLNKFQFNALTFGEKLKEIWENQLDYSKAEFARLLDVSIDTIESHFDGNQLPDINIILKATKLFNLPRDFFFHPSINLRYSFWKEDLIKYSILSLVRPKNNISHIDNAGKFYSDVIYDLAINIQLLYEWIYNGGKIKQSYSEYVKDLSIDEISQLKNDLARQYYKILEQYPEDISSRNCTIVETIIRRWFNASDHYISRIIIEAISKIDIKSPDKSKISYRFVNDIMRRKVMFAGYDCLNLKMYSKKKG